MIIGPTALDCSPESWHKRIFHPVAKEKPFDNIFSTGGHFVQSAILVEGIVRIISVNIF